MEEKIERREHPIWSKRQSVQIRLAGLGGQGVVLAGAILGEAGSLDELRAAGSSSYGSQARGGACKADVILSLEEIDFPHVNHPDLMGALSQEAYELYAPSLSPGGLILYDGFFVTPQPLAAQTPPIRQYEIPATQLALERIKNRQTANILLLGALLGVSPLVRREAIEEAIRSQVRERFVEINFQALELGFELGQKLAQKEGGW